MNRTARNMDIGKLKIIIDFLTYVKQTGQTVVVEKD